MKTSKLLDKFGILKVVSKNEILQPPEVTIILPVFNQEHNILFVIESIIKQVDANMEILIFDDNSSDATLRVIKDFLDDGVKTFKFTLYSCKYSMYETWIDNFLISLAEAPYILEIQADMVITSEIDVKKFINIFQNNSKLMMVSGRGTEPWLGQNIALKKSLGTVLSFHSSLLMYIISELRKKASSILRHKVDIQVVEQEKIFSNLQGNIFPSKRKFQLTGRAGFLAGNVIFSNILSEENSSFLYLGESVMRGPLFIEKSRFLSIGGFDTQSFFLGFDDHDISLRAWQLRGLRVGFIHIPFTSILEMGSTRKSRTFKQVLEVFIHILVRKNRFKSSPIYNFDSSIPSPSLIKIKIDSF
jgi:glycosyltransferase involved in cell wall biosynthesis